MFLKANALRGKTPLSDAIDFVYEVSILVLSVVYVKGIENVETHAIRTHIWIREVPL